MSTTRINERISSLVRSQLPEFIESEYPLFVTFIETYYRYLEQDQQAYELIQNARKYTDIDQTAESFIQYFLNNYGKNIPVNTLANKKLLLKRIKDLYESKGSELSFKLLFNILFDTDVELEYPYENVLKASDGIWEQLTSLKIETVTGNPNDLLNRFVKIQKNNLTYTSPVLKIKRLTPTITEVFLYPNSSGIRENVYELGDQVYVEDSTGILFTGTVAPTTTGFSITSGGLGFRVGQIFTINNLDGRNTLVKVTSVTPLGAITGLKFINYGYGYTNSFTVNLIASEPVSLQVGAFVSRTGGFLETGTIYGNNTGGDEYFAEDYILSTELYDGGLIESFFNDFSVSPGSESDILDPSIAVIEFDLGAVGRYPGTYLSNKGFISDAEIRLQDDQLYQPFAYLTKTEIDYSIFFDVVKSLIHPAGQKLFNNRILSNEINLISNISVVATANLFTELRDVAETIDSTALLITRALSDVTGNADNVLVRVNKAVSDNTSTGDGVLINITHVVQDLQPIQETIELHTTIAPYGLDRYFVEDYTSYDYAGTPLEDDPVYVDEQVNIVFIPGI